MPETKETSKKMSAGSGIPDELLESVKFIQECKGKKYLSREQKVDLNRAKLRIAYWVCRSENIIASRENLAYILGPEDGAEIMGAYDKYLVSEEEAERQRRAAGKRKKSTGTFWEGA